jgi:O-antigen/teichoic acid export membrane protein
VDWRPGLRGRRRHLRDLWRFNANVLATYALGQADDLLPRGLVAALLGPHALGHYLLARRVFDELSRIVTGPLAGIAMASTARAQDDRQAVQRIVLGLYETAALLALPCFFGLAVLAPVAVPLVFGPPWAAAVPALQVLLLCGVRTASGVFNVSILRALGRPDLPLILLGAGVALGAVLIPSLAPWGLPGVMAAILLRTFATWPLGCGFVATVTGIPVRQQLAAGGPALVAALAMAVLLWPLQTNGLAGLPPGAQLAAAVAAGTVAYGVVLAAVSPRTMRRVGALARAVLGRDDSSLAAALGEPRPTR